MRISRVVLKNGVIIDFPNSYKTVRGVRNQAERFAKDENSEVLSICYRVSGDFIKV